MAIIVVSGTVAITAEVLSNCWMQQRILIEFCHSWVTIIAHNYAFVVFIQSA